MSRTNPIGLRISSKTLNSSFIGIDSYYFYSQLKQNLVINQVTQQLSKYNAFPASQVGKHNADRFCVLYPALLPINSVFIAKQLFSIQYTVNKRRFFSTALYYTRWLQQKVEHKNFLFSLIIRKSIAYNKDYKVQKKFSKRPLNNRLLLSPDFSFAFALSKKKQKANKSPLRCPINFLNKAQQISTLYQYLAPLCPPWPLAFGAKAAKLGIIQLKKKNHFDNTQFFTKATSSVAQKAYLGQGRQPTNKRSNSALAFALPLLSLTSLAFARANAARANAARGKVKGQKTKATLPRPGKTPGERFTKVAYNKSRALCQPSVNCKNVTKILLKDLCEKLHFKPNKRVAYYMLLFICITHLSPENNNSYLVNLPITRSSLQQNNRKKRVIVDHNTLRDHASFVSGSSSSANNSIVGHHQYQNPFYVLHANSNLKKIRPLTYGKIQKNVYDFRDTLKTLPELLLVINRTFCQPAGINYISALENRLSKSCFSSLYKSAFYNRTGANNLKSNFINIQSGFNRSKSGLLFEFLYIRNNNSVNNDFNKLALEPYQKKWLRKGSSIRL